MVSKAERATPIGVSSREGQKLTGAAREEALMVSDLFFS